MQLNANKHALSALTIVFIVIIIVGLVVTIVGVAALFGFWHPFGQVVGSGKLVTEEKGFTDFTIVEVGWGFEVEIDQADSHSINITADDNMFDYIEVSSPGNRLTIGLRWGYTYRNATLRAEIAMPDLYGLEFSGGTQGVLDDFSSQLEILVELSGGSSLTGDFTTSEDAEFTLSGGSRVIELDGGANDLRISGSGGSQLDLSDFSVHDVSVNLSGGSSATIDLDGRLDGDLSGGSHLKYEGNPTTVDVSTSGGSTVGPK